MSNGNSRSESIWPLVTVIVGIIALGAVVWDVMLHRQNQALENRLQKLETHVNGIEAKDKAAEAAAAVARRKARAAAATSGTGPATHDQKSPGK